MEQPKQRGLSERHGRVGTRRHPSDRDHGLPCLREAYARSPTLGIYQWGCSEAAWKVLNYTQLQEEHSRGHPPEEVVIKNFHSSFRCL